MTSTTFFIIFIPILAVLLLAINLILAPHNPYQEKDSVFECGFHSFLGQNRTQFSVSFFIFGLLFLLFDLEILLVYPYSVSSYTNDIYGLVIMMVFFVLLTLGFIFELGKNALTIDSRQTSSYKNNDTTKQVVSIPINILQSSMLPSLVEALDTIVSAIPAAEELYETVKEKASDAASIPALIDEWAFGAKDKIEVAYDATQNCDTTGETKETVEACKNSAKALCDSGKEEVWETSETAKDIYEDRK